MQRRSVTLGDFTRDLATRNSYGNFHLTEVLVLVRLCPAVDLYDFSANNLIAPMAGREA